MSLVGLLVVLIVFALLWWAARSIMAAFAVPPQVQTIVTVVFVLIFMLWLLQALGLLSGGPVLRLR